MLGGERIVVRAVGLVAVPPYAFEAAAYANVLPRGGIQEFVLWPLEVRDRSPPGDLGCGPDG